MNDEDRICELEKELKLKKQQLKKLQSLLYFILVLAVLISICMQNVQAMKWVEQWFEAIVIVLVLLGIWLLSERGE